MKLFITNKKLQGEINKAIEPIKEENEKLRHIISKKEFRYLDERDRYKEQLDVLLEVNSNHQNLIAMKEKEIKNAKKLWLGERQVLINKLNELQNKITEAEDKLSQRYILKELKPSKPKKTQTMKIKSGSVTSKIIKKVVENE